MSTLDEDDGKLIELAVMKGIENQQTKCMSINDGRYKMLRQGNGNGNGDAPKAKTPPPPSNLAYLKQTLNEYRDFVLFLIALFLMGGGFATKFLGVW